MERARGLRTAIDDPRIQGKDGDTKLVKSLKAFEKLMNAKNGAEEIIERINPFRNAIDDEKNKDTVIPGDAGDVPDDNAEPEKDQSDEEEPIPISD